MTQGDRVKEVRKALGLTLEKFGEKVGVTKQTISRIENCINNLTEQMAKSICREFNVDYTWLTTGNGEMFIQKTRCQTVTEFTNDLINEPNSFKTRFIEGMAKLNARDWEEIERIVLKLVNKDANSSPDESPSDPHGLYCGIRTEEELVATYPPVDIHKDVG